MHADVESWISSSIFFALDCDSHPRVELFSFEFFKTLLENFALVCRWIQPCDISWLSSYFLISRPDLGFRAGS